jgi:hypothetical protein
MKAQLKTYTEKVLEKLKNRKPVKYSDKVCKVVYELRKKGVSINTVKKKVNGVLVTYYYNGKSLAK